MAATQLTYFPYGHFFRMIGGKWKPYILVAIDFDGSIRFNALLKFWGQISSKVLAQNLRELEEDKLICRVTVSESDEPGARTHTEYRLAESGIKIMPVIKEIYKFSIDDMIDKDIRIDSRAFDYYNPANTKKKLPPHVEAKKTSASARDGRQDGKQGDK